MNVADLAERIDFSTTVYRMSERSSLILIRNSAIVLVPFPAGNGLLPEAPADMRDMVDSLMAELPVYSAHVPFGELLAWACRRMPLEEFYPKPRADDDGIPTMARPTMDSQPCIGAEFNRVLIREMLQVWVETRMDTSSMLRLGYAVHDTGHVLRIRSGTIIAVAMCLRMDDDERTGTDHIPGDWKAP
jgi:hypothetical protein